MQIVAVVDADAATNTVAVWHVDIGSVAPGMSRMCGAWVITNEADKVELLTRDRLLVATPAGAAAIRSAGGAAAGTVDLAGTVNNVASEQDRLQAIYDSLPASRRKTLAAPSWPHVPAAVDLSEPPKADNTDPVVAVALGLARFLERLANAWADGERERIARSYLIDNTPGQPTEIRDLPVKTESA